MMSTITTSNTFSFAGYELRALSLDGKPWFVAKDLADILDYSDAYKMTQNLDNDEKRTITTEEITAELQDLRSGGRGNYGDAGENILDKFKRTGVIMVNESGLYTSIFASTKDEAKVFRSWVTNTVLPQIRETGSYGNPHKPTLTFNVFGKRYFISEQFNGIERTFKVPGTHSSEVSYAVVDGKFWVSCESLCSLQTFPWHSDITEFVNKDGRRAGVDYDGLVMRARDIKGLKPLPYGRSAAGWWATVEGLHMLYLRGFYAWREWLSFLEALSTQVGEFVDVEAMESVTLPNYILDDKAYQENRSLQERQNTALVVEGTEIAEVVPDVSKLPYNVVEFVRSVEK